jgi:hypothetical protein
METYLINEKKEIKRKFKKCFDVINFEEKNSKKYLNQDLYDRILVIIKIRNDYFVNCYSRSDIYEILKPRNEPPYISKVCFDILDRNLRDTYYPLTVGNNQCFFTFNEMKKLIETNHRIYYVEPYIRQEQPLIINCQGNQYTVYKIKVW